MVIGGLQMSNVAKAVAKQVEQAIGGRKMVVSFGVPVDRVEAGALADAIVYTIQKHDELHGKG